MKIQDLTTATNLDRGMLIPISLLGQDMKISLGQILKMIEDGIILPPSLKAQYSADGTAWHTGMKSSDEWIRISDDGGATWGDAMPLRGKDGQEGLRNYTWLKFADDGDGTGMSDSPKGKTWLGIAYNKDTEEESDDPADYKWIPVKGDAGRSVKNVVGYYGVSLKTTIEPKKYVAVPPGKIPVMTAFTPVLWKYETTYFSDGTEESTEPGVVSVRGDKGSSPEVKWIGTKLQVNGLAPVDLKGEKMQFSDLTEDERLSIRGTDGDSAFESWKKLHPSSSSTLSEWLDSLNGKDGKDGATPEIDPDTKEWKIKGKLSGILAQGKDGHSPVVAINSAHRLTVDGVAVGDSLKGADGTSISAEWNGKKLVIKNNGTALPGVDLQGASGTDGKTPEIDPTTKKWKIGDTLTNIRAEGLSAYEVYKKNHTSSSLSEAQWLDSLKLKFSDLTASEKDSLKLHFSDLTASDKESLKGHSPVVTIGADHRLIVDGSPVGDILKGTDGTNGTNGTDGKTWKPKVGADGILSWIQSSDTKAPDPVNIKGDKMKFSDLTAAEKDSLKLKFADLTAADKESLRGAPGTSISAEWNGTKLIIKDNGTAINSGVDLKGAAGAAAVVYSIVPSADKITKSYSGTLTPAKVSCSVYKTTGSSSREATADMTLKYQFEGVASGAEGYAETEIAHPSGITAEKTVPSGATAVVFTLYNGSMILCRNRIAIVPAYSDLQALKTDSDAIKRDYVKATDIDGKIDTRISSKNLITKTEAQNTYIVKGDAYTAEEARQLVYDTQEATMPGTTFEFDGFMTKAEVVAAWSGKIDDNLKWDGNNQSIKVYWCADFADYSSSNREGGRWVLHNTSTDKWNVSTHAPFWYCRVASNAWRYLHGKKVYSLRNHVEGAAGYSHRHDLEYLGMLSTNDFTDALFAKLNGIAAGANLYIHPTATATTIAAASGKVLSAITVNGLGHVTSVASKTLAAADIPSLPWSKITSGKPTTLSGYGITDAKIENGVITLGGKTITPITSHQSIHALTIKGNGTALLTYNPKTEAAEIDITPAKIGASPSNHTHTQYAPVTALNSLVPWSKRTVAYTNGTNLNPQFINIENENLISGYTKYWSVINLGSYSGNNFRSQIAMPYQDSISDTDLFIRTANGADWRAWRKVLHDGNTKITNGTITINGTSITPLTSHQSLANYVTTNTAQRISGGKTFNNGALAVRQDKACGLIFYSFGDSDTERIAAIEILGASGSWLKNSLDFYKSGRIVARNSFTATSIIKSGGTSSQFLMADGSVKALTDITSAYVTALGTSGNYLTWTKNGAVNNITVPYAAESRVLRSYGRITAVTDNTAHGVGVRLFEAYHNGYPTTYGNVLAVQGSTAIGGGELLMGWSGTSEGHASLYYRNRRDTASANWSAWATILDSVNFNSVIGSNLTAYVKKAGDTMTGTLTIGINAPSALAVFNQTGTNEPFIYLQRAGVYKAAFTHHSTHGTAIYNTPSQKYLGIKDDGTPHYNGNVLLHAGNYAATLDPRYVNVSGDTMTGALSFSLDNQLIKAIYNSTGSYSNVLWVRRSDATVIYGSPQWAKVVLETSGSCAYRQTSQVQYKIWDAGNDGAGSGLDADLLDGVQGVNYGYIRNAFNFTHGSARANITTAQFIETLTSLGAFSRRYWSVKCSWSYANNDIITDTGLGNIQLAGAVIEVISNSASEYTIRVTTSPTSTDGAATNAVFIYRNHGSTYAPNWKRLANTSDNVASATKLQTARTLWGRSFDGTGNVDGTLRIQANESNYCEGIRIKPTAEKWTTIVLGGSDLTANSGTSAKSWSIHNNDGKFYINMNGAGEAKNARAMATSTGWTFGNTSRNTYALNAASFICDSWIRTVGSAGWYSETYGGGWCMTDSTWIRIHGGKSLYAASGIIRTDGELQVGGGGDKFRVTAAGAVTATSFTKRGGTANQILAADGSVRGFWNHTIGNAAGIPLVVNPIALGNSDGTENLMIDALSLSSWNGAYTKPGSGVGVVGSTPVDTISNLAYCVKGKFGDIVTHNASEFLTSGSLSGYATQSWVNSQGFLKSHTHQVIMPTGETSGITLASFNKDGVRVYQQTNDKGDGISYCAILSVSAGSEHRYFQIIGGKGSTNLRWRTTNSDGTALGAVKTLLDSTNTYLSNGTITINGASIKPLISHQSLANYVTKNTAQEISGAKTFTASMTARAITPQTSGTYNLGSTTSHWNHVFCRRLYVTTGGSDSLTAAGLGTAVGLGWLELRSAGTPYIDFTGSNSTADYNVRLAYQNSQLEVNGANFSVANTIRSKAYIGMIFDYIGSTAKANTYGVMFYKRDTYFNIIRTKKGAPDTPTSDHGGSLMEINLATNAVTFAGVVTASNISTSSDARLKTRIADISLPIADIAAAPLWRYRRKDTGVVDVGSTAQYWGAILPELTRTDEQGWMSLDYGKTALLASVSLARKADDHEARIKALEAENRALREKIARLEAA